MSEHIEYWFKHLEEEVGSRNSDLVGAPHKRCVLHDVTHRVRISIAKPSYKHLVDVCIGNRVAARIFSIFYDVLGLYLIICVTGFITGTALTRLALHIIDQILCIVGNQYFRSIGDQLFYWI